MKIYLDVCCLNRPFDEQDKDRIRLESEAVLTIFNRSQTENWILISSEAIYIEISKIPDDDKRQKVSIICRLLQFHIDIDEDIERRAIELENIGFKSFDALHIACAEKGKADVLLTTDDKLLNSAFQKRDILKVRVENPVRWLMEVI
jgi:predicted nucleic acid-binding protein